MTTLPVSLPSAAVTPANRPAGTIFDLAASVLARTGPITSMQLHRLAYSAQAWHLAATGELLTADPFEARFAGPVSPELYEAYHSTFVIKAVANGRPGVFTGPQRETISRVVNAYKHLTAGEFTGMIRADGAYQEAWGGHAPGTKGRVISTESIRAHYTAKALAPAS